MPRSVEELRELIETLVNTKATLTAPFNVPQTLPTVCHGQRSGLYLTCSEVYPE